MRIQILTQPSSQLGTIIDDVLTDGKGFSRIVLVSAFTALRTILRLREKLVTAAIDGAMVRLVLGIDLGGTSREVLEELVQWGCEVLIFHNPLPRATFHPKLFLFQKMSLAHLFIGSNNLTDGGLYTNYEVATYCTFKFPKDQTQFEKMETPLHPFLDPSGATVRALDLKLIKTLVDNGMVPSEADARRKKHNVYRASTDRNRLYPNPFSPTAVPRPPLLPRELRPKTQGVQKRRSVMPTEEVSPPSGQSKPEGLLVWRKILPRTDALQVRQGSHHVGGVRLTQAGFTSPLGERIDQTTYFRNLFADYNWEPEPGGHGDQEHAFVPFRIFIEGNDYGVRNFEISHKPSGEAGQANYTTILRWGRSFTETIQEHKLTGAELSLYEISDDETGFLMDIVKIS